MHKQFVKKYLFGLITINIFSEDRYLGDKRPENFFKLYKHNVTIYIFGLRVFHTNWRTGIMCNGEVSDGGFYYKGDYRNDYQGKP